MKDIFFLPLFLGLGVCSTNANNETKPNILFLLADDLGYGELGSYGQQIIKTPVLDSLASQGMRFTDFYAGSAVSSPSRAVLLTGKSSSYNTIRGNNGHFADDRWMRVALKKDELTLGEMMKDVGYETAFIGKWHVDDPNDLSTWAHYRGFDYAVQEQWGSRFGGIDYDPYMHWINGKQDSIYYNWTEWESKDHFRTELAINYLDNRSTNNPFFLFMSYRAPHGHERRIGNNVLYADKDWPEKEKLHAAKITLLDAQIGRLLKKLEEIGELDNTLIFFTSDNGPHQESAQHDPEFFNSNGNLRGIKRDLYEGGVRVPLIAVWKNRIAPGLETTHVSGFQDIMPTIAEVAGIHIPEQTNGISIWPVLTGKKQTAHCFLNWEFQLDGWTRVMLDGGFRQSVRLGNWKAVRYGIQSETELYNLETDISESNNIASEHPEIIEKMHRIFEENRSHTTGYPYGGVIQHYSPRRRYEEKNLNN